MQFLEKLWKICEKIEILKLRYGSEETVVKIRNQKVQKKVKCVEYTKVCHKKKNKI